MKAYDLKLRTSAWMNLRTMVREICLLQKNTYGVIPVLQSSKQVKRANNVLLRETYICDKTSEASKKEVNRIMATSVGSGRRCRQ